jgi:hypothetical protein
VPNDGGRTFLTDGRLVRLHSNSAMRWFERMLQNTGKEIRGIYIQLIVKVVSIALSEIL